MESIFEHAKFGDKFKTRNGKKAIFVCHLKTTNLLIIEGMEEADEFSDEGVFLYGISQHQFDIVSEWKESINEEELEVIALPYVREYVKEHPKTLASYTQGFKAGYRRAKEG